MSSQRYPEEFKTEAVKQILDHGHSVADVSNRLGVSTHSLYKWLRERQMMLPPYSRPRPSRNKAPGPSPVPGALVQPAAS